MSSNRCVQSADRFDDRVAGIVAYRFAGRVDGLYGRAMRFNSFFIIFHCVVYNSLADLLLELWTELLTGLMLYMDLQCFPMVFYDAQLVCAIR